MADTPTPTPLETAQELATLNTQLGALNAAGDAGKDHEFNALGGVDAKLALLGRIGVLTGALDAGDAARPEETGPKLSDDPAEAAIGLTAPAERDPQAVEARLELLGADTKAWSSEDRAFARGISEAVPPALVSDAVNLLRDAAGMVKDAGDRRYSETVVDELTAEQWGNRYDERWDYIDAALKQLQPRERQYLERRHLLTYPAFLEKLATLGEKFLGTDEGIRWTLAQHRDE